MCEYPILRRYRRRHRQQVKTPLASRFSLKSPARNPLQQRLRTRPFMRHLALIPQRLHLGITGQNIAALRQSLDALSPYLAEQGTLHASKTMIL